MNNIKYKGVFFSPGKDDGPIPLDPGTLPDPLPGPNESNEKPKKKNLVTSLKELVVAFGGAENVEAVKGNKIIEILKKLKEAIVSSGATTKELPKTTATDNGKILTVSNGAWAKGDAPLGLIITFSDTTTGKLNSTWGGINDALKQGRPCFIKDYRECRAVVNTYYESDDEDTIYYVVAIENGKLQKWRTYNNNNGNPERVIG